MSITRALLFVLLGAALTALAISIYNRQPAPQLGQVNPAPGPKPAVAAAPPKQQWKEQTIPIRDESIVVHPGDIIRVGPYASLQEITPHLGKNDVIPSDFQMTAVAEIDSTLSVSFAFVPDVWVAKDINDTQALYTLMSNARCKGTGLVKGKLSCPVLPEEGALDLLFVDERSSDQGASPLVGLVIDYALQRKQHADQVASRQDAVNVLHVVSSLFVCGNGGCPPTR